MWLKSSLMSKEKSNKSIDTSYKNKNLLGILYETWNEVILYFDLTREIWFIFSDTSWLKK